MIVRLKSSKSFDSLISSIRLSDCQIDTPLSVYLWNLYHFESLTSTMFSKARDYISSSDVKKLSKLQPDEELKDPRRTLFKTSPIILENVKLKPVNHSLLNEYYTLADEDVLLWTMAICGCAGVTTFLKSSFYVFPIRPFLSGHSIPNGYQNVCKDEYI